MARTERGQYRFTIQESDGGFLKPAGDEIEKIRGDLLGLDLHPGAMRSSSRRQSPASPSMTRSIRGEDIGWHGQYVWQFSAQEALALPHGNNALQQEGRDLVDDPVRSLTNRS